MATYQQIQDWVKQHYNFTPKTCWIAHVKKLSGLPVTKAPNRIGVERVFPCPDDKIEPIRAALRYFGMI
ncbi:MAG TPA: hypothetical protein PLT26_07635 [Anaerolineaceae bacterium]|nr:hypothetical protein [Anaerolineaceae bacterium]HQH85554.1 hypothetical protein [Anaerolineaceae bacterium]